ncbi:MAG TPA: thioredoxin domain-containing protein [Myxococcaceae bacterium]|nr:thioredoxin domain-containing protein [Myxococcaceae bacterium]
MRTALLPVPLVAAAFFLTAATCNKGGNSETPPSAPSTPTASAPAPAESAQPGTGGSGDDAAKLSQTLAVPGMDFSSLSSGAQRELAAVFTDEFCYCGCPHTLGQCLKEHKGCRHAKRMANIAAQDAQAGAPSVEIIQQLGKYYQSFREARRTFKTDDRMCHGAKDAKVTFVEFADFECPHCGFVRPVLEELVKKHGDKVRVCFMPYPLEGHPNAIPAAIASLVARDKGKFWEMHDQLFANQLALSTPAIKDLAAGLGLSAAEVQKAIDSGKYTAELNGYKEAGKSAGVAQTPTIFLNGRAYELARTVDQFDHAADDELEWSSNNNAWAKD